MFKDHCRRGGKRSVRVRVSACLQEISVFWTHQGSCPYEHTVGAAARTRPVQVQDRPSCRTLSGIRHGVLQ